MTSPANTSAQVETIIRELLTNSNFADLCAEDLTWLATTLCERLNLQPEEDETDDDAEIGI